MSYERYEKEERPQEDSAMQVLVNHLFAAFKFFNRELWSGMLPPIAIQIGEKRGARGVFRANYFVPKEISEAVEGDMPKMHEIIMNPTCFTRPEKDVLSTFVHEMVHLYEQEYGKPGKGGYHNREWAESMKEVGLWPSDTGEPGGKETGRKMSHYIVEGGLFDNAADEFIEENQFKIEWVAVEKPRKVSTPRKRTYRCSCPQPWYSNLSGRKAVCSECGSEFIEDEI